MQRSVVGCHLSLGRITCNWFVLVVCLSTLALLGCGQQGGTGGKQGKSGAADEAKTVDSRESSQPASSDSPAEGQEKPRVTSAAGQPAAAPTGDDTVRKPATVAEAAKVIDLREFPRLEGAGDEGSRTVAHLSYPVTGNVKAAFEFQRKNLLERKWKELSEPQITDQSGSGEFTKDGFHLSASVFSAGKPGEVSVMLQNHGNLNHTKLPLPPGAKLEFDFPGITSFITEGGLEETTATVRKLLTDAGWQPYRTAGDTMSFKQNAIQLDARVLSSPAQQGKTAINFSSAQLSADLPAPPDAEHVQYADPLKQLNLDAQGTPAEVVAYYQKALAPAGWKATTEEPIKDGFEWFMIFRNPAKDMLTLTMRDLTEEKKTRVTLVEQSAADVAALEAKAEAQAAAKKKKDDEEKSKPKPKAAVTLPEGADGVEATATKIEFQVASGKGKSTAAALGKELEAAGWKAEALEGDAMAGSQSFKKQGHTIDIDYVDPGIIPAEITISAKGVELERKGE